MTGQHEPIWKPELKSELDSNNPSNKTNR